MSQSFRVAPHHALSGLGPWLVREGYRGLKALVKGPQSVAPHHPLPRPVACSVPFHHELPGFNPTGEGCKPGKCVAGGPERASGRGNGRNARRFSKTKGMEWASAGRPPDQAASQPASRPSSRLQRSGRDRCNPEHFDMAAQNALNCKGPALISASWSCLTWLLNAPNCIVMALMSAIWSIF